jgi:hypothetical protein
MIRGDTGRYLYIVPQLHGPPEKACHCLPGLAGVAGTAALHEAMPLMPDSPLPHALGKPPISILLRIGSRAQTSMPLHLHTSTPPVRSSPAQPSSSALSRSVLHDLPAPSPPVERQAERNEVRSHQQPHAAARHGEWRCVRLSFSVGRRVALLPERIYMYAGAKPPVADSSAASHPSRPPPTLRPYSHPPPCQSSITALPIVPLYCTVVCHPPDRHDLPIYIRLLVAS